MALEAPTDILGVKLDVDGVTTREQGEALRIGASSFRDISSTWLPDNSH
jgi:hypothetical protein